MLNWLRRLRGQNEAPATTATVNPSPPPAPASAAPPVSAPPKPLNIPHDKIASRAYEIWVRKGKPHGQDFQNWAEAEAELRAEFAANPDPEPLPRKSR